MAGWWGVAALIGMALGAALGWWTTTGLPRYRRTRKARGK